MFHGILKDYRDTARRWQVYLQEWGGSPPNLISTETQRKRERFLFFLVERGSFYLQPDIISIYLPLTLGQSGLCLVQAVFLGKRVWHTFLPSAVSISP